MGMIQSTSLHPCFLLFRMPDMFKSCFFCEMIQPESVSGPFKLQKCFSCESCIIGKLNETFITRIMASVLTKWAVGVELLCHYLEKKNTLSAMSHYECPQGTVQKKNTSRCGRACHMDQLVLNLTTLVTLMSTWSQNNVTISHKMVVKIMRISLKKERKWHLREHNDKYRRFTVCVLFLRFGITVEENYTQ